MFSAKGDLGLDLADLVFSSREVSRIAQASLRQLQWWEERDAISPRRKNKRRIYGLQEVLEIVTIAALRRKGLSLQKIRRVLRPLRRALDERPGWVGNSRLWLLTDGKAAYVEDHPEHVLARLLDSRQPMHLLSLSDQMRRIASEEAPRRRLKKQLRLF